MAAKKNKTVKWKRSAAFLIAVILIYVLGTALSIVSCSGSLLRQKAAHRAARLSAEVAGKQCQIPVRAGIDHAVDLYNDGYVNAIIMTGGVGEGNIRSEADIAREYAEQQGVPAEVIFKEEESSITAGNLEMARQVMSEQGFNTALIVSDPLHMKRAMMYADDLGMKAYSSPTPTSLYRSWKTKLPFLFREEFFYIGYRLTRLLK